MASSGRVSRKDQLLFNSTASGVGGVLDHLQQQLDQLEAGLYINFNPRHTHLNILSFSDFSMYFRLIEIKADEEGVFQYKTQLMKLGKEKKEIEGRVEESKEWAAMFDSKIGPFRDLYDNLTNDITVLYDNAKEQHAAGLELLFEEFQYHPAYKRWSDTFSSIPFKPA